jgi:PIN like domain
VQRDEVVFFVDRCLGAHTVPNALREAGAIVEVHGDHFPPDASDPDILRFVGARGWVFLSKDENVRRRRAERQALAEANVAAFILTAGRAKGDVIAAAFVTALGKIRRTCRAYSRPVIATVSAAGAVVVLEGVRRGGVRRES